jgi:AcrR family transcriptional regulator
LIARDRLDSVARVAARRGSRAPKLRRHPSDRSAGEIVDSIVGAASLLLDRDGIEGLTTNAVARVAGVSVGSVYRYFPDKHAIVAEIARRIEAIALAITAQEAQRLRDATAKQISSRVVSLSHTRAFGTVKLRRALLREVPRGWILADMRSTDATISAALTLFYGMRAHQLRPIDLEGTVFVVQHAIEGVGEAILLAEPDALPDPAMQRELFHLAWSYIAPDGDDLARPPVEDVDLIAPEQAVDEALAARLLHEPSARRVSRARLRKPSARSISTREAILDATERLLAKRELADLDVRSIVGEAGYAVGALYRHFPNVDSTAAAVAARIERRAGDALVAGLSRATDLPSVCAALTAAYAGDDASSALRRRLLLEIPRCWIEETTAIVEREAIDALAGALRAHGDAVRDVGLRLMAFVAFHTVKTVCESYEVLEPPGITRAQLRRVLEEVALRYLMRRAPA